MRFGKLSCIFVLILASIALAAGIASAANVPVEILEIELDNTALHDGSVNILNIENGAEIDIDFKIMANMSADYVQIKASISGYDSPDREKVSEKTAVFDVEPNVTYWKSLELEIPENMDEDMYKLRIVISDRANEANVYTYNLKISSDDHAMEIRDVIFSPEYGVEAGKVFQTIARIRNNGQKDEGSVKVTVSVPDLGISGSSYVDMVESEDSVTSEEIWLRVPECAESGFYDAFVSITYDEGYSTVSTMESLAVTGDFCAVEEEEDDSADDNTITNFVTSENDSKNNNKKNTDNSKSSRKEAVNAVRKMLENSLIVLVIALVIAGLIIGFIKLLREGREL